MFGTLTELHRWRSRVGIALAIAGTAILILGVLTFIRWLGDYDPMIYNAQNGYDIGDIANRSMLNGEIAFAAFVSGIPILLLGVVQVWLASRRNALIEGAMLQMLVGSERGKPDQTPTQ